MGDVLDEILEGQHQAAGAVQMGGIIAVVDGDEANAQRRKELFDVPACLNVLTAKAGEILDDDTVDPADAYRFQHFLKTGPLKVGARIAVIVTLVHQLHLRMLGDVGVDQIPLIFDAVALHLVAVLLGEAAIGITIKKFHENNLLTMFAANAALSSESDSWNSILVWSAFSISLFASSVKR